MHLEKLLQTLSDICGLSPTFKQAIIQELRRVSYPRNHLLVQVDSIAQQVWFLCEGYAISYYYSEKDKVVTRFYKAGDFVLSPLSFCRQLPSQETIQLMTAAKLFCCSYPSINRLLDRFAEANTLARAITAAFHADAEKRLLEMHGLSPWARYQKLINNYPRIELYIPQALIASYLNIAPQSLSRMKSVRCAPE